MGFFDKIKKYAGKTKKPADKPRKPAMDESDNPSGAEAGTSWAKMMMGDKKKKKQD